MAVLGKIRSRGMILIGIIGLGLLAFIAEEAFRSCEATRNNERQQIGEVYGKKISVQEFQKMVDEYTDAIKMQQGQENLNEEQLNQVKDMVWNSYVQSQLIEKEAEKLGLTVTDQELQNILAEGTNPMLLQTPFVNQQTGRFDAAALKKFLADTKHKRTPIRKWQSNTLPSTSFGLLWRNSFARNCWHKSTRIYWHIASYPTL